MRLGLVTYNLARDWDVETIISRCTETGFEGVELRTTHAHKVEIELSHDERIEVRKRFADSAVEIAGLGSVFEYDAVDHAELRSNIKGTMQYAELAHDLGVPGIKVRPNKVHVDAGVPVGETLEQIGLSLRECGIFASDMGVQIRLEVHGRTTSIPKHIRTIIDHADHENVKICWNSNVSDMETGSIDDNFALLRHDIGLVHITELWNEYPWRRLLQLLREANYEGFCLAEIPESADAVRLMHYYRALWLSYADTG